MQTTTPTGQRRRASISVSPSCLRLTCAMALRSGQRDRRARNREKRLALKGLRVLRLPIGPELVWPKIDPGPGTGQKKGSGTRDLSGTAICFLLKYLFSKLLDHIEVFYSFFLPSLYYKILVTYPLFIDNMESIIIIKKPRPLCRGEGLFLNI